ncbi:MAG: hypothetical protein OES20_06370 [Gammaproteobacteria bacterium]|nr:hypothetical protein [Gammaproteobacteria bacterium]MDH3856538.1 hypothetical protein [Gammaproteobacteria bacterium]
MGKNNKISLPLLIMVALTSQPLWADAQDRAQAKRIHDRLVGVTATNATIDAMEALLISDPTGKTAAEYAIDTAQNPNARFFYNVTLKNFAAPWTNEEQTVFTPLNDYSATVIGLIRDGGDFRQILHGDIIYRGDPGLGIAAYSNSNNNHYEQLEALGPTTGDLANPNILEGSVTQPGITQSSVTGLASGATAGVMTTRAGAMAFFSAGTNRAMFRFTLMNHLCTDLEPLKDVSRSPDKVRRDVSRSPGGDSRLYMNGCVGCHAGMDGMAGAFAFYEWDSAAGRMLYQDIGSPLFDPATGVSLKHNINGNNFEYGHITEDDSWINYWRNGPNSKLGLRPADDGPNATGWGPLINPDANGNETGNGAKSLGIEMSNSKAFAQCQVDKAFKSICLRDPNNFAADRSARDGFVSNLVGSGYDMREVFTDVAAYCKGS